MNRTLVETVCSMLSGAKLPKKFWAEALNTAVYLPNCNPSRTVQEVTPFEALTKQKPDVSHFRVFGCLWYAHTTKEDLIRRQGSLSCWDMALRPKHFSFLVWKGRKYFFSRDVVFTELRSGIDDDNLLQKSESRTNVIQLDCLSEDEVIEEQFPQIEESNLPLRRYTWQRKAPHFYGDRVTIAEAGKDPTSFKTALDNEDKDQWIDAMDKEIEYLKAHKVWDLVELPIGSKTVGSKWVFKIKKDVHDEIERYKAWLVAQGCSQQFGQDYDEKLLPVVRFATIRVLLALVVQYELKLHQMDIKTAFLNEELKEDIYMKQPEGLFRKERSTWFTN